MSSQQPQAFAVGGTPPPPPLPRHNSLVTGDVSGWSQSEGLLPSPRHLLPVSIIDSAAATAAAPSATPGTTAAAVAAASSAVSRTISPAGAAVAAAPVVILGIIDHDASAAAQSADAYVPRPVCWRRTTPTTVTGAT